MRLARACRGMAIVLAVIAIVDPRVSLPRRARPGVRVVGGEDAGGRARLVDGARAAGFALVSDGEAATLATRDARIDLSRRGAPIYAVTGIDGGPDISVQRVSVSPARVAGQAVSVSVTVHARGARGQTSQLQLDDAGLPVVSASHRWTADAEQWQATLSYLPPGAEAVRLRVRASALPGERDIRDNVADLLAPPLRGPLRTLVYASDVTWPAVFVRRALEDQPGFAVSSLQRSTTAAFTRAGSPPTGLTERDLAPYEVLICGSSETGGLDTAGAASAAAVRWFVEERGGLVVFVPDRAPAGRASDLLPGVSFVSKVLDTPVSLTGSTGGLMATELAIPSALPPLASALASDSTDAPIVFAMRRGLGAIVVSGALDAWRYRDAGDAGFARFWAAVVLAQASAVPPALEVTTSPSLVRPGDVVHVSARLRPTEFSATRDRIEIPAASVRVTPVAHGQASPETPIRVWPGAEPGLYEGEWRPSASGDYVLDAGIGDATAAAVVRVTSDASAQPVNADAVVVAAAASGGGTFADEGAAIRAIADRFPAVTTLQPSNVARSPWWAAAFAVLLCVEWALRRRQGLS